MCSSRGGGKKDSENVLSSQGLLSSGEAEHDLNPDLRLENVICTALYYSAGSQAQLLAGRPRF